MKLSEQFSTVYANPLTCALFIQLCVYQINQVAKLLVPSPVLPYIRSSTVCAVLPAAVCSTRGKQSPGDPPGQCWVLEIGEGERSLHTWLLAVLCCAELAVLLSETTRIRLCYGELNGKALLRLGSSYWICSAIFGCVGVQRETRGLMEVRAAPGKQQQSEHWWWWLCCLHLILETPNLLESPWCVMSAHCRADVQLLPLLPAAWYGFSPVLPE